MDTIVQEIANVGITILVVIVTWILINWLDRNVFNKGRYKD